MAKKTKRIFATNEDMGSAQAMAPALKALAQQHGWNIMTYARGAEGTRPNAAAYAVFEAAGLAPNTQRTFDGATMREILRRVSPDLVLVGISCADDGSEKAALKAAVELGLPTACMLETWPHRWLSSYGDRDTSLYQQVGLLMVWDEVSRKFLLSQGFETRHLVVTGNPSQDAFIRLKRDRATLRRDVRAHLGIPQDAFLIQWAVTHDLDDLAQDNPKDPEWLGFCEVDSLCEYLRAMRDVHWLTTKQREVYGVVRQKPSYEGRRVRALIELVCPHPHVIFDKDPANGNPLLLASDVVVGGATMMIQNAAMLGLPGYFYFPDLCKPDPMISTALGFTTRLERRGDLYRLIRTAATSFDSDPQELKPQREINLPSDATGNVVKAIRNLLRA